MTNTQNILLELEPNRLTNIMNVENIDLIPEELRISIQTVSGRPKNYYYANENEYKLAVKQFIPYMWDAEDKIYDNPAINRFYNAEWNKHKRGY